MLALQVCLPLRRGVARKLWSGRFCSSCIPVQEVCPAAVLDAGRQRQNGVSPRDRPVVAGPLGSHASEAATGALHDAASDVHASLSAFSVLHAAGAGLHASYAFRHVLVPVGMRPETGNDCRDPVVLQPFIVRFETPPALGPVGKDRLQRVGQIFRGVEEIQDASGGSGGEELFAYFPEPACAVGDRHQLLRREQAVPLRLPLQTLPELGNPAAAGPGRRAVDEAAADVGAVILLQVPGLRVPAVRRVDRDHLRLAGPRRAVLLLAGLPPLLDSLNIGALIGDKAFDADWLAGELEARGCVAATSSRSNRKVRRDHDREMYERRHQIENFLEKIKEFRTISTRCDKTVAGFRANINLVAGVIAAR